MILFLLFHKILLYLNLPQIEVDGQLLSEAQYLGRANIESGRVWFM